MLWIHASNAARFEQSVRDVADLVKIYGRKDPKANIFALVRDWLRDKRKGRWVIVLDNADDASFLVERDSRTGHALFGCLPVCEHGTVLITTRSDTAALSLVDRKETIGVRPMDEEHALALLEKKLGQQADRTDIVALACALEYMPLAIAQAAAYIKKRAPRCSVPHYLEQLERNDRSKTNLLSANSEELRRDSEAKNSIIMTWQISFEHIRQSRSSAADLLSLMSFFHHQGIPESLLRIVDLAGPTSKCPPPSDVKASGDLARLFRGRLRKPSTLPSRVVACAAGEEPGGSDASSDSSADEGFEEDIITLREYHFISVAPGGRTFEMHRLVQLAAQKWLEASGQYQPWAERSIRHLDTALPNGSYENWQKCRTLSPHASVALDLKLHSRNACLWRASVLYKAAWFAWTQGSAAEAESLAMSSRDERRRLLDEKNEDTLASEAILALVLQFQGKYEAAEAMNRRALEGSEKVLGKEHPNTLTSVGNLASVLRYQGKYEAAEAMHRRALEGHKKVLGKEHPDTLTSVSNLALVLQDQGKYEAAEAMNRRALEGREKVLGKEHPNTLTSVSNLALVLQEQGKYEAAEAMNRQALEGREKVLGKEHPDTLTSVGNLASVLRYQGKYEAAEAMNRQALEGREKVLGKEHPNTLTSVGNLALVLRYQGKSEAAEAMHRRALEGYKKVLGKEHPDTLTSVGNLALMLQDQGKYEAAEAMHRRALEGREKVLGKEHPDTLTSVWCLASLHHVQHQHEAAIELFERAHSGFTKHLGPSHPTTVKCFSQLSALRKRRQ